MQLVRALRLSIAVGCCFVANGQKLASPDRPGSVEKRVRAIQIEAQRIDDANDASETQKWRRLTKDLPNWQFSGLFENSSPVFVTAQFTQGELVRAESYYFVGGKTVLVKVLRWWDVDDSRRAPEPTTRQDFYIENDQIIRHTIKLESKRPITRTDDKSRSAAGLVDRAHALSRILLGGADDAAMMDYLESFPDAEQLKP